MKNLLYSLIFAFALHGSVIASWKDSPITVVKFNFGKGANELEKPLGSMPPQLYADECSNIVVYLWYKSQVVVVSKTGTVVSRFDVGNKNRSAGKIYGVHGSKIILHAQDLGEQPNPNGYIQVYDYSGKLLVEFMGPSLQASAIQRTINKHGIILYDDKLNLFWRYNYEGKLMEQTSVAPLTIGRVKGKKIMFEDFEVRLKQKRNGIIMRDKFGDIYSDFNGRKIQKYDRNGSVVATIMNRKRRGAYRDQREIAEWYGNLLLAGDGNVYQWRKTKNTYEVLRYDWNR